MLLAMLLNLACASAQEASPRALEGTVKDTSGAVIAGARVTLDAPGLHAEQRTTAGGRFRFERLSMTGARLTVSADGFASDTRRLDDLSSPLEIVLRVRAYDQEVVVTPQRSAVPLGDIDATIVRFSDQALSSTAALSLDDKLRQVPGFSLLRRTGSRGANPTSQGLSLRGTGANGASRALVLADGVPLNDPFGGWVYWDRVPGQSIEAVEVMEGGGSHLYGSSAIGGLVNVLVRRPQGSSLDLDLNGGTESNPNGSLFAAREFGPWAASVAAEAFQTDGYFAVLPPDRGTVDTPVTLRYGSGAARVQRRVLNDGTAFASLSLFNEGRGNGTLAQENSTRLGELTTGLDHDSGPGRLALRAYGQVQSYSQTFSSIAANRTKETLTSWQRVPAQQIGGGAQWSGLLGSRQSVSLGAEASDIRGVSNEITFLARGPSFKSSGGEQFTFGSFGQDSIRWRRMVLTLGARVDRWSRSSLRTGVNDDGVEFSPHAGFVVHLPRGFNWSVSGYRSFRVPSLNELDRDFRVGNVLTLANAGLQPEHLNGAESGIGFTRGRTAARANFFWAEVTDPVANVTLTTTAALITRQRQNLGSLRSRGLELSVESRLPGHFSVRSAYQFADATVLSSPGNPALVGLLIPQVPRHQVTFTASYSPARWVLSAQARVAGRQFDDDQNLLPLSSLFTADLFASHSMTHWADLYVAGENLFDRRYMVGRTPTPTWGPPLMVRAGVRIHLAAR